MEKPPFTNNAPSSKPFNNNRFDKRPRKEEIARINHHIRALEVRVIGVDGEMLGVLTPNEGIRLAKEAGVDLVEISPNASPPVCKLIDYGKFKYEFQKKKNEAKKKQKQVVLKEIQIRPAIGQHDLEIKKKSISKFLDEGDKVKITIRFRGRELSHTEIGRNILNKIVEEFATKSKIEFHPRMEGKQMIMILAPGAAK